MNANLDWVLDKPVTFCKDAWEESKTGKAIGWFVTGRDAVVVTMDADGQPYQIPIENCLFNL